jgi:hypothetical protein
VLMHCLVYDGCVYEGYVINLVEQSAFVATL